MGLGGKKKKKKRMSLELTEIKVLQKSSPNYFRLSSLQVQHNNNNNVYERRLPASRLHVNRKNRKAVGLLSSTDLDEHKLKIQERGIE